MAASTVTRSTWTDDPGTGLVGTIINNAELQKIYDAIDLMLSGTGSYTTLEFGGGVKIDGVLALAGYKETKTNITVASNTIAINMALGSLFDFQATADINTTTVTNIPASGGLGAFRVRVKGDGTARAWAFFAAAKWDGNAVPARTSTNNKFDHFAFETMDGGTTWSGFVIGQNRDN